MPKALQRKGINLLANRCNSKIYTNAVVRLANMNCTDLHTPLLFLIAKASSPCWLRIKSSRVTRRWILGTTRSETLAHDDNIVSALNGLGMGSVYAKVNPLQITGGVPAAETGSAISFYQLVRTVAYAIASALSATVLVESTPAGHRFPTDAGYTTAALVSTAALVAALLASSLFLILARGGPG